ncbi:tyrosinase family oxidase copper chaperone [Actinokineospora sp. HUAS TT18]|uniref:tyrosinase family oxidase copper chaperone n=1 Tax=Actinokineospora sp. HUAS TT18 TaxID=3447451 RepID=UPI003F5251BF
MNNEQTNLSRRRLLTGAFAVGALSVVGVSGALIAGTAHADDVEEQFEEVYKGRTIKGLRIAAGKGRAERVDSLTIDGETLHLMRHPNGTYASSVNHYRSFRSLRETGRTAVDTLGTGTPRGTIHGHH